MSIEENKALVRRFITEVFEQGRLEAVDELRGGKVVEHWHEFDRTGLMRQLAPSA